MPLVLGGSAFDRQTIRGLRTPRIFADVRTGRYIRYGVREHAMAAIMTVSPSAALCPYGGTFLVFADYMRGPSGWRRCRIIRRSLCLRTTASVSAKIARLISRSKHWLRCGRFEFEGLSSGRRQRNSLDVEVYS